MRLVALAAAVCLAACGGSSNSGSGNGGPPAAAQHRLTIHIAGPGQVTATSPAFTCTSDCQQTLDASATVQLTATPAAGATFSGFSGACSGTGACSVSMASDMDVTATFAAAQANGTLVTVQLVGTGHGQVTSQPTGIECPGACAMSVGSTPVTLTAKPDANSTFAGYGGACSGTSCVLTSASANTVFVNFVANAPPPPADECAGLVPASAGTPVQESVVFSTNKIGCGRVTSDGQGNVAAQLQGFGDGPTVFFAPDGTRQPNGDHSLFGLVGLPSGFQSIGGTSLTALVTWAPSGTETASVDLGSSAASAGNVYAVFDAVTGGSVALRQDCDSPATHPAGALVVSRFDAAGNLVSKVDLGGKGCAEPGVALSDALDHTLVVVHTGAGSVGLGPKLIAGRWLNRDGTAITDWFQIAPFDQPVVPNFQPRIEPLIGGGAVVANAGTWIASFASGSSTPAAVPAFAVNGDDFKIVRGSKAYASFQLVPDSGLVASMSGVVQVFAPSGKSCGSVPLLDGRALTVGRDGTAIASAPGTPASGGCDYAWWSKLFQ